MTNRVKRLSLEDVVYHKADNNQSLLSITENL